MVALITWKDYLLVQNESIQLNSQILEIGKTFTSFDEAYNYFKHYAQGVGFNIRKGNIKIFKDRTLRKQYIFYSRKGIREENRKNDVKYNRRKARIGYDERVRFMTEDG